MKTLIGIVIGIGIVSFPLFIAFLKGRIKEEQIEDAEREYELYQENDKNKRIKYMIDYTGKHDFD